MNIKKIIIGIFYLLSVNIHAQQIYYVANTGNDNNSGLSTASAFKTLQKINSINLNPGDKILFKSGDSFKDNSLEINSSGAKDNYIVIGKYGGDVLPIIGSRNLKSNIVIHINNADFIIIENLLVQAKSTGIRITGNYNIVRNTIVKGGPESQENVSGIIISGNGTSNYNLITNNEVMTFGNGILGSDCLYTVIENNKVHDIWRKGGFSGSGGFGGQGIRLISNNYPEKWFDFKYTSIIRNNKVYDFERYAIDCATATNVIIESNIISDNLSSTYKGTEDHGSGIKASERNNITYVGSTGNIIRYNIIHKLKGSKGNANNGIVTLNSEDGWIYGNLIYNIDGNGIRRNGLKLDENIGTWSWRIFNNTIFSNKECVLIWADAESPTYIQNNIFFSNAKNTIFAGQDIFEGNNIYINHNKENAIVQKYQQTFFIGQTSFYKIDPKFINFSQNNFALQETSPAVNSGINLGYSGDGKQIRGYDIVGAQVIGKPDIGAFEYTNEVNHSAPIINIQPTNQFIEHGTNVTFSIKATCADSIGYQWWKSPFVSISESKIVDNIKYSGAKTNTLVIKNINAEDANINYLCEVYNVNNHSDLWVNSVPVSIKLDSTISSNNSGLKVFLEAPFSKDTMAAHFYKKSLFPKTQPYREAPWNIEESTEAKNVKADYVDWILIELRNNLTNSKKKKLAIVKTNGMVVNPDGTEFNFSDIISSNYYIVIHHRNHLSIMSADKVTINNNEKVNYDFTNSVHKAYGNNSLVNLGDNRFGMIGGDSDKNGRINNLDFGVVANNIPGQGYLSGDLDMNGVVNVLDYLLINKNILKKSNVP